MRKAFSETLTRLAAADPRIAFVTGDLGFQVFDEFEKSFPGRYINAGVAEAQMIYTAAGMASEGWKTVAYSIASFATARPFEQIRYCVAYPNLPVILVGAGRGYLYSNSGVSHHAGDDFALMTAIPNMTVVAPGDPVEIEQLLPQLFALNGPSYFTVGRFGEPSYDALEPAVLGKARLLREGSKVAIIGTGEIANEILKAHALLLEQGIDPIVYQMHTVKPLDTATLDSLSRRVEAIVIVEEHVPSGGLWSAVTDWKVQSGNGCRLVRLGAPDRFALGNLKQDELRKRWGFDADAIARTCVELWNDATPAAASLRSVDADALAALVGSTAAELPPSGLRFLAEKNLRFREATAEERDRQILASLMRLEELKARGTTENQAVFQAGWNENYQQCLAGGVTWQSLKPKYVKPFSLVRYDGRFVVPEENGFIDDLFAAVLTCRFEKYLKQAPHIYEFGCGTGRYLFLLAHLFPEKNLTGLDWTDATVGILDLMRREGLRVEGKRFDMLQPDEGLTLEPGSAAITISSLEQLGENHERFLSYLLAARPSIVLHHEPIDEFYDTTVMFDHLASSYHRKRGYLSGYWSALKRLAEEGRIEILEARRGNFGDPYHDGASFIAWRPKE